MTLKTRLSVLLLSTPIVVFVVVGGLMGNASARAGDETFQHLKVFGDVVSLVMNNYVEEVKVDRAMEGALKGLADGLDPDSAYLNAQQVADVQAGAALPDGEIGLELTRQYYLRVIAARDGSPAAKAGLQTGDYVRAIDGKPTREMSVFEGMRLLHGQVGSKLLLTVIRGNAADPH
ncbi:MAG: PDZ domain-containing protein, partial [Acidobacteriota bacterium]